MLQARKFLQYCLSEKASGPKKFFYVKKCKIYGPFIAFFHLKVESKPAIFSLHFLGFLGKTGQNFPKLSLNLKLG